MTPGIDLKQARELAEAGSANDNVVVSRRWLRQAVSEIEAGRAAAVEATSTSKGRRA